MYELKQKIEETSEMKKQLCEWAKTEMSKGMTAANTAELGEVIDMIKDLAQVEKDLAECCYHKKIVEAMDEAKGDPYGPMGYNRNRYADGRYAPSGHGNYTQGYHPSGHEFGMDMMPPYMMDDDRMGYTPSGGGNRSQSGSSMGYGYTDGTKSHIDSMRNMYEHATTDQEKRQIKEDMTRLLNEMR